MNYKYALTNLRDRLHREIIKEAVSICMIGTGIIEFNEDLEFYGSDYMGYPQKFVIMGIDCNTGLPVDKKNDLVDYKYFTVETLVIMHNLLVNKKAYTAKPDLFV